MTNSNLDPTPARIPIHEAIDEHARRLSTLRYRVDCLRQSLIGTTLSAVTPEPTKHNSLEDKIFAQYDAIAALEDSVAVLLSRFGVDDSLGKSEEKPRELGRCAR